MHSESQCLCAFIKGVETAFSINLLETNKRRDEAGFFCLRRLVFSFFRRAFNDETTTKHNSFHAKAIQQQNIENKF